MSARKNGFSQVITKVKTWARMNSPWVLHFNSGSCNGCDIEILAILTPRYDVERFGIKLQGSPRHADVLLCTGPGIDCCGFIPRCTNLNSWWRSEPAHFPVGCFEGATTRSGESIKLSP